MNPQYLTSNDGTTLGQPAIPRDTFTQAMAELAKALDVPPPKGTPIMFETPWGAFCTSDRDQWPAEVTDYIVQMFTPKLF